jgi:hypothetical protein
MTLTLISSHIAFHATILTQQDSNVDGLVIGVYYRI